MADNLNTYGRAQYGVDTYGGAVPAPVSSTACLDAQPGYCPSYVRFQFSGVNLGLYIFELNPSTYDIYPQRTTQSYSYVNEVYGTIDEDYMKLEIDLFWNLMPYQMYQDIKVYSRKLVDGTSEDLYFWDANMGRFCGKKVKIEEFEGRVIGGYYPIDRHSVRLKLREV